MPASRNIPPQRAHSFSAGYSIALDQDNYEFSSELYYKRLHNQMESASVFSKHEFNTVVISPADIDFVFDNILLTDHVDEGSGRFHLVVQSFVV